MSQPVKLSDGLVLDARIAAEVQQRSIAGQVEFWARLGRSIEPLLNGQQAMALSRTVGAKSLFDLVDTVEKPAGRARLKAFLESEPFPHFEAHPTKAGMLVRIDESGNRTSGRFVNREFVVEGKKSKAVARSLTRNPKLFPVKGHSTNRKSSGRAVEVKTAEPKADAAWA